MPVQRFLMIPPLRRHGRNFSLSAAACGVGLAAYVVAACSEVASAAEPLTGSPLITFNIPAQPLATALQAYGERAGVQVLYESRSAVGRQSSAVEGKFTRDEALNLLLLGSGLQVHYTKPDAITLALPSSMIDENNPPPVDPLTGADLSIGELRVHGSAKSSDLSFLQDYSESVQADIQAALRKNAKTRSGNYRVVVDVWIGSARTIEKAMLLQSTGDKEKDTAVVAALQGLTTSRPVPANTPQPVRVAIVVKSSL
jgi:hypothetical protein